MNQGGTADKFIRPWQKVTSVRGFLLQIKNETGGLPMIRPTLDEVRKMTGEGKYKYVPLSTQMLSDVRTPIEVLRILKNVSGHCYLLESAEEREKWGRYTFLGFDPTMRIS